MRGAKVALHEHFDGTQELRWHKTQARLYGAGQTAPASTRNTQQDGRVDKALVWRNMGYKPAPNHPWRKTSSSKSAPDGRYATP